MKKIVNLQLRHMLVIQHNAANILNGNRKIFYCFFQQTTHAAFLCDLVGFLRSLDVTISLEITSTASSTFIPNFADVSKNAALYFSARFSPTFVSTCLSASRSHLFPMITVGTKSASFTLNI